MITVVIPCAQAEMAGPALAALDAAQPPSGGLEILLTLGALPSAQRNQAVDRAAGEIIYFLDNDSQCAPDSLRKLEAFAGHADAAGLGGPSLSRGQGNFWQRLFALIWTSPLAIGNRTGRYRGEGGIRQAGDKELILCNLAVRRDLFQTVGGFDESLYPNEENEFIARVQRQGHEFYYDPALPVYRPQRPTLQAFVRQVFTYGRGRGEEIRRSPGDFSPIFALPVAFLAYMLSLPLAWWQPLWLGPLALYVTLALAEALRQAVTSRQAAALLCFPGLLLLLHLLYPAGLIIGLIRPRHRDLARLRRDIRVVAPGPETGSA